MRSLFSLAAVAHFLSLQDNNAVIAFQTPLTRTTAGSSSPTARSAQDVSLFGWSPLVLPASNQLRWKPQQRQRHHLSLLHAIANDNKNNDSTSQPSSAEAGAEATDSNEEDDDKHQSQNPFKQAYHLYVDYFDRLWSETDVDQRQKLSRQRAIDAVMHVKNMVNSNTLEEYLWQENSNGTATVTGGEVASSEDAKEGAVFADLDEDVRIKMEEACDLMLDQLEEMENKSKKKKLNFALDFSVVPKTSEGGGGQSVKKEEAEADDAAVSTGEELPVVNAEGNLVSPAYSSSSAGSSTSETELTRALASATTSTESSDTTTAVEEPKKKKKKGGRSVLFGATLGLAVAGWVYSGNYIFTGLFTLMTALGQLEYYRMVMNTGIYPARRISVFGACAMFVTALFAPDLHQIVLPVASTWAMIWFLTMRRSVSTISEIATTFTGMFYLGYIPSFWVRIRQLGGDILQPTRLAPLVKPILDRLGQKKLPGFLPKTIHFPITEGANFIFWTWLCIAFSDVGGYFAGRNFGKTKLGAISPAAGKTSPNKTVEGVIGGCAFSLVLATLGAWIQKWPYWWALGPIHGVTLALLGLVGDLTASMLKRDAGLKDFGDLIPEHGGIMDRVDSYIFTAPYGWIMCGYVIPWLKRLVDARAAAAALLVV